MLGAFYINEVRVSFLVFVQTDRHSIMSFHIETAENELLREIKGEITVK